MKKDRAVTERRILDAVGRIVETNGFEAVGPNTVAAESGVSKVLIYRYFGTVEQLLAKYIEDNDFWLNFDFSQLPHNDARTFSKEIFKAYIELLRKSPALRKLYRWDLSTNNPQIDALRQRREELAMQIIDYVCQITGQNRDRVAGISTLLTASVSYVCILAENCDVYNSLQINDDAGWQKISDTIDFLFDKILD